MALAFRQMEKIKVMLYVQPIYFLVAVKGNCFYLLLLDLHLIVIAFIPYYIHPFL
jgi:hypothetical protein